MTKNLVFLEAKAQKQLEKLSVQDQARIIKVLNALEEQGLSAMLDIKML
ncbi:MAG: hypothetical protein QM398_08300 [Thermoproteota archaeon]|nr:hypothetical protein [Thermoproteota archaeon]NLD65170.1 hypothetical protein [Thermoproteota archaeon]